LEKNIFLPLKFYFLLPHLIFRLLKFYEVGSEEKPFLTAGDDRLKLSFRIHDFFLESLQLGLNLLFCLNLHVLQEEELSIRCNTSIS
jgi:hypothetical protein